MRRQVTLPDEVVSAIDAEELRQPATRSEVLVDFFRACWPAYVAQRLADDLTPPVTITVEAIVDTAGHAVTGPTPGGSPP